MGADLNNIVKTQRLSDDHVQFLVYQILRGMKYVHSAGIIHRVSNYSKEYSSTTYITHILLIYFWGAMSSHYIYNVIFSYVIIFDISQSCYCWVEYIVEILP